MKLTQIEHAPLGLLKLSLVISKESLTQRIANIVLQSTLSVAHATALQGAQTGNAPTSSKEDQWAQAVNECILAEFPPIFDAVCKQENLLPLSDPDFDLTSHDLTQDLNVMATIQTMPPLTLGSYTGFTERIIHRTPTEVQRMLHINQHYGAQARASANDPEALAQLHKQAEADLIQKGHALAVTLAEQRLLAQLGLHVTGELPSNLLKEHYYKEKQRFSFQLQSKKLNFDVYLEQRGQTVEQFRAELHAISEQKLRAELGLLLVAQTEQLLPTDDALSAAFSAWLAKKPKDKTFEKNDLQKVYRTLCKERAAAFVIAHSTLTT